MNYIRHTFEKFAYGCEITEGKFQQEPYGHILQKTLKIVEKISQGPCFLNVCLKE